MNMKSSGKWTTLLLAAVATVQSFQPKPIPSTTADYGTGKPLIISQEGVYVCPDGWDMYVTVQDPKSRIAATPETKG